MAGSHGDLYSEIGKLVLAAHAGQTIDLAAKSEELARRYWNLGVPSETIAKAIVRSLGAIGVSMELISRSDRVGPVNNGHNGANGHARPAPNGDAIQVGGIVGADAESTSGKTESPAKAASALFPSGVRLAVLS